MTLLIRVIVLSLCVCLSVSVRMSKSLESVVRTLHFLG